jgi:hypothetical protein
MYGCWVRQIIHYMGSEDVPRPKECVGPFRPEAQEAWNLTTGFFCRSGFVPFQQDRRMASTRARALRTRGS